MQKKIILIAILLVLLFSLQAKEFSLKKAALYSTIFPGMGQAYLGNYTKAGVFWTSEIIAIFSYFKLYHERDLAINDYEKFALNKANINLESPKDLYQSAQDFYSSESYNDNVEMVARNVYIESSYNPEKYNEYINTYSIPDSLSWNWESEKSWNQYKDLRRRKQNLEIYAKFSIAAMILNRMVSVVDASLSTKRINQNNKYGKVFFTTTPHNPGVKLNYELKF